MQSTQRPYLLIFPFPFMVYLLLNAAGLAELQAAPRFTFATGSDLTTVHPQQDSLHIVIDDAAEPTPDGQLVHVQLLAPSSQVFSSTDFPVVEGSTLFEANIALEKGRFEFSFVPPIRGTYQLSVRPLTPNYNLSETTSWTFAISENPLKVKNLAVFLAILGLISGISGYVLGITDTNAHSKTKFNAHSKSASLLKGLVLTLLLGADFWPNETYAHGHEHHEVATPTGPSAAQSEGQDELKVELQLLTPLPRVGVPAKINGALRDRSGHLIPARFQLRFTQLEHGIEVFSTHIVGRDGTFQWQGQFYDGSTHRMDLEAVPLNGTAQVLRTSLNVEVQGIAPPVPAVSKSFASLMAFAALTMALGYGAGRFIKNRASA